MKAYKGFDKDFKCKGFQYEVGKTYEENEAKLCSKGFHACENPLDTFRYYPPTGSRYAQVDLEANGERGSDDSKVCGRKIEVGAEIGVKGIIDAGVRFVFSKCENAETAAASGVSGNAAASGERGNAAASGVSGNAAASGERGNAAASGERGTAVASGEYGLAAATGEQCIAVAWGNKSAARGAKGCWLVLSEHYKNGKIKNAQMVKVDGEEIKANTWYALRDGKVAEVKL